MNDELPSDPGATERQKPVMRVTTGSLKVPEGLGSDADGSEHQGIDRIALAIAAAAIVFILFVAWLISRT